MTLTAHRGPLTFLALFLLLSGLPGPALALSHIQEVSKERAKKLGITVLLKPRKDDVWARLEFTAAGAMKEFRWADLEVTQGGKRLVRRTLRPQKPAPDRVRLECSLDPTAVAGTSVTIFVYNDPRVDGGIGYRLRLKDFPLAAEAR
jgi:hypothetical protein